MSDKGEYLILDNYVERNKINVHKNIFILSSLPTSKLLLVHLANNPEKQSDVCSGGFSEKVRRSLVSELLNDGRWK